MPSNIENANISAIKLGTADVVKGYIGHDEVYPNTRTITSAAFTDTSTLSSSGGTRAYRVSGAIGSQYSLTGTNGASSPGSQTLSASPTDYSISVGANSSCGSSSRTPTITILPTGSTALGGGVSSTSSFTQSGVSAGTAYSMSMTASIQDLSKVTTTVGGVVYYAPGSTWNINVSWTIPSAISWGTQYYQYLYVSPQFTSYAGSSPGLYVINSPGWSYTSSLQIYDSTGNQFPTDRISTGNQQSGTSSFTVEYRTAGGGYQPQYAGGVRLAMYGPVSWGGPSCSTLNGLFQGNTPSHGTTTYLYP